MILTTSTPSMHDQPMRAPPRPCIRMPISCVHAAAVRGAIVPRCCCGGSLMTIIPPQVSSDVSRMPQTRPRRARSSIRDGRRAGGGAQHSKSLRPELFVRAPDLTGTSLCNVCSSHEMRNATLPPTPMQPWRGGQNAG
jgi:hypothetical protein